MNLEEHTIREILEEVRINNKPIDSSTIDEVVLHLTHRSKPTGEVLSREEKNSVAEQEVLKVIRSSHPNWRERARAAARIISLGIE